MPRRSGSNRASRSSISDDQLRLLKQILAAANIDERRWPARVLHAVIERWKDRGLTPDKVSAAEIGDFADGRAIELYRLYQERLATVNAVDFGDLLLHNLTLFQTNPDILATYQHRFRYLLVDEYQDTNVAQYLWLRLLAQQHKNICCVGDDDQSIYRWRGAQIENILKFESDFPGALIVRLEENYRSTPEILAAAAGVIAHNRGRLGKTLWTRAGEGDKITVRGLWDAEQEARWVGDEIEALQRKGHALSEIAILVRAGFQTREFEERFIALALPYRVIGGPRFYERQEIRDAMAYLRLIHQPADDLAFERIVNTPRRGIGTATLQVLHAAARAEGSSLVEAARGLIAGDDLPRAARNALGNFLTMLDRWRADAERDSHVELVQRMLDESGYTGMWQADTSPDAPGRLENLKELVVAMAEFENLGGFLEHVSLVMDNAARHRGRHGQSDDSAQRQGARIRHGISARLGGGRVSLAALDRGRRPSSARGGAAARLCRADPGAASGADLVRRQPAHPRPMAGLGALALCRRIAQGPDRGRD